MWAGRAVLFCGVRLLLQNRGGTQSKSIGRYTLDYVKRILLLYIVWTALHLPAIIRSYASLYPDASLPYLSAVIFRRIVFCGYGVYWYLLILAESAFIVGMLSQKRALRKVTLGIAVIGLLWSMTYDADLNLPVISELNDLVYFVFSWSNNLIMKGIPYFAMGFYIGDAIEKRPILQKKNFIIAGYALLSVLCTGLHFLCDELIYVLLPIQVVFLFFIGMLPTERIPRKIGRTCRNLSTVFYFTHGIFISFVIDKLWPLEAPILLRYTVTITLCLLTYLLVMKLKWKPLKWLMMVK